MCGCAPCQCHIWDPALIAWALLSCIISRSLHVLPISFISNKVRPRPSALPPSPPPYLFSLSFASYQFRKAEQVITKQIQFMIIFAGLRGAMAFAIAMRNTTTHSKKLVLSTTLSIVLITVIFFGGSTMSMLQKLRIRSVPRPPRLFFSPPPFLVLIARRRVSCFSVNVHDDDDEEDVPEFTQPTPGMPRALGFVTRSWVHIDRTYIKPVLSITEDNQGTDTWSNVKRTITNAYRGIPEQFAMPEETAKVTRSESDKFEDNLSLLDESVDHGHRNKD